MTRVALIGFGEAASAFVAGWKETLSLDIRAYDIKIESSSDSIRLQKMADYDEADITGCTSLSQALRGIDIVFSLVTADQALVAAKEAAHYIEKSAFYFDCNSCAPQTKRESAKVLVASGVRYIDVAVMAPVHPAKHRVPLLVSGPDASEAIDILATLDMNAVLTDGDIGAASSVKMMRSVMIKGMESLMLECIVSARKAGVDEQVLNSLEASDPDFGWRKRAAYMLERVMVHGERRAAEMREAVTTIDQLGIESKMAKATVEWQQIVGEMKLDASSKNYEQLADNIIKKLDD